MQKGTNITMNNPKSAPRKTGCTSPITRARMRAGLTQAQLADAIGQRQKDISRWERGVYAPRADVLLRISAALGCRIEDLLAQPETPAQDESKTS